MHPFRIFIFSVFFLLIANLLLHPLSATSMEIDSKTEFTMDVYSLNWNVSSYSLSDGFSREPDTSYAALSFYEENYFEVEYYCGAVRGKFTLSSGVLVTKDASILDDELECATGGEHNPELNKLLQSTFLNTTTMIEVEDGKLIVSTEANETISFVE